MTPRRAGTVTCAFRLAGLTVATRGSITKAGRATCQGGVLPAGAAGSVLRGTVTYALRGARGTRSFTSVLR